MIQSWIFESRSDLYQLFGSVMPFYTQTKFAEGVSARTTLALQYPAIRRMHVHGYTRPREDVQREAIV